MEASKAASGVRQKPGTLTNYIKNGELRPEGYFYLMGYQRINRAQEIKPDEFLEVLRRLQKGEKMKDIKKEKNRSYRHYFTAGKPNKYGHQYMKKHNITNPYEKHKEVSVNPLTLDQPFFTGNTHQNANG